MEIKKIINQRFLEFLTLILFLVIPFTNVNHTSIYVILELICVYGVVNYSKDKYDSVFILSFLWFFIWCIVVTLLSVNPSLSFKGLTSFIVPPLLLFGLADCQSLKKINNKFLYCSMINLILSGIFCCVENHSYLGNYFLTFISYIGIDRKLSSTLCLCLIVFVLFFNDNEIHKIFIIVINVIAGLIVMDKAFIFCLFVISFLYLVLVVKKVRLIKVILGVIVTVILLKLILVNCFKLNLHIIDRLSIYSYWLPKVLYSPFYGVGLTLKLQSLFFNAKFPVSPQILAVDANVKLHSHNYFLDLTLQAGFIGLILMLNFLYQISRHSYKLNNTYGLSTAFMILAIFMKYMVDDQMEGSRGLIFWFFIVLTYVKVLNLGKHKLE